MTGARPVLVVDDDPIVRSMIGRALEDAGIAVITAEDGRQALDEAQIRGSAPRATDQCRTDLGVGLSRVISIRGRSSISPTLGAISFFHRSSS